MCNVKKGDYVIHYIVPWTHKHEFIILTTTIQALFPLGSLLKLFDFFNLKAEKKKTVNG